MKSFEQVWQMADNDVEGVTALSGLTCKIRGGGQTQQVPPADDSGVQSVLLCAFNTRWVQKWTGGILCEIS